MGFVRREVMSVIEVDRLDEFRFEIEFRVDVEVDVEGDVEFRLELEFDTPFCLIRRASPCAMASWAARRVVVPKEWISKSVVEAFRVLWVGVMAGNVVTELLDFDDGFVEKERFVDDDEKRFDRRLLDDPLADAESIRLPVYSSPFAPAPAVKFPKLPCACVNRAFTRLSVLWYKFDSVLLMVVRRDLSRALSRMVPRSGEGERVVSR